MSLREKLNNSTGLAITVVSLLVAVAVVLLRSQFGGSDGRIADQSYYTDDDGQTYFADAAGKDVPFRHDGKEAVAAFVYRSQGKTSVHYMMRKHPGSKQPGGSARQAESDSASDDAPARGPGRREYKRPGEKEWKPQPPGPLPVADKSQPEWITP